MAFHLDLFHHKLMHQQRVVMGEYHLVEVQHLKIVHHVVQHQKRIEVIVVRVLVVKVKNHQKMIILKKDIGTIHNFEYKYKYTLFFKEMIVIITHLLVAVHRLKSVYHHLTDHIIEVENMNTNDQEMIENHQEIEMINMNVMHESIFSFLFFCYRL
jgi:phosphopantetheine adenylyltransferase